MNIEELKEKIKTLEIIGEQKGLTENNIENINNEISQLEQKILELREKRINIENHLNEIKKLNKEISRIESINNDLSKEQFIEKLKQIFKQNTNLLDEGIEDINQETKTRLTLLGIEYLIIRKLYLSYDLQNQLKLVTNYRERGIGDKNLAKKYFQNLINNIIYGRFAATKELYEELINPWHYSKRIHLSPVSYNTYNEIINIIEKNHYFFEFTTILKGEEEVLNINDAETLYKEILIPYYKKIGFPYTSDEKPYMLSIYEDKNELNEPLIFMNNEELEKEERKNMKKHSPEKIDFATQYYTNQGVELSDPISKHLTKKCYIPVLGIAPDEKAFLNKFKMDFEKRKTK